MAITITVLRLFVLLLSVTVATIWGAPEGRIVGGQPVNIENHPHQVAVLYLNVHNCGGSLISETWVITAAHCVTAPLIHIYTIRAGTSFRGQGGQVRGLRRMVLHPDYAWWTYDYDIAVLLLTHPFAPDVAIRPISMPAAYSQVAVGTEAVVTGWGAIDEIGPLADQLKEVRVPVLSLLSCRYAYGNLVTDNMICASSPYGGRDACGGDSGGPLTINGVLYGLVAWGYGCASSVYPGVYISVPMFRGWIWENTGI